MPFDYLVYVLNINSMLDVIHIISIYQCLRCFSTHYRWLSNHTQISSTTRIFYSVASWHIHFPSVLINSFVMPRSDHKFSMYLTSRRWRNLLKRVCWSYNHVEMWLGYGLLLTNTNKTACTTVFYMFYVLQALCKTLKKCWKCTVFYKNFLCIPFLIFLARNLRSILDWVSLGS